MSRNPIKIAILIYAISGCLAFGHHMNNHDEAYVNYSGEKRIYTDEKAHLTSIAALIFNPMYWSYVAFKQPANE